MKPHGGFIRPASLAPFEQREPAVSVGLILTAITSLFAVGVAFGLPITDDQQTAILGLVAAVAPIVAAVLIRGKVYSPATVDRIKARHRVD